MWKRLLLAFVCVLSLCCLYCYGEGSLQSQSSEDLWTALESNLESNEQELAWLNEQLQQRDTDLQNVQEQLQILQQEMEQQEKSFQSSKRDLTKWKTCCWVAITISILEAITIGVISR